MAGPNVVREMGETIVEILRVAVADVVPAENVKISTPDSFHDLATALPPTITVFLYRIGVNSVMRNGPRVSLGQGRTTRPLLPLDLSYLITPWVKDPREQHALLGLVLQAMYDHAELGPADLVGKSWSSRDSVQLIQETLTLEEHFCIWDTVESPYRLSLTYMARILGIRSTDEIVAPPIVQAAFKGGVP
jgi:hypothetical protein